MSRTLLGCTAMAVLALSCRADSTSPAPETLIRLNVTTGAGPQAGASIPAPPRARGDESRQPHPELHEVFRGAPGILPRQGGPRAPRGPAGHAAQGAGRAGAQVHGRVALSQADRAARLDNPDWQILLKLKADGIGELIPDVQAAPAGGRRPEGAVPGRGGAGPVRRRDPHRQE